MLRTWMNQRTREADEKKRAAEPPPEPVPPTAEQLAEQRINELTEQLREQRFEFDEALAALGRDHEVERSELQRRLTDAEQLVAQTRTELEGKLTEQAENHQQALEACRIDTEQRMTDELERKRRELAAFGELPPTPAAELPDGEVPPVVANIPAHPGEGPDAGRGGHHGRGHRHGR